MFWLPNISLHPLPTVTTATRLKIHRHLHIDGFFQPKKIFGSKEATWYPDDPWTLLPLSWDETKDKRKGFTAGHVLQSLEQINAIFNIHAC